MHIFLEFKRCQNKNIMGRLWFIIIIVKLLTGNHFDSVGDCDLALFNFKNNKNVKSRSGKIKIN